MSSKFLVIIKYNLVMASPRHYKTKTQMANDLGISLRTFQRWLKEKSMAIPRGLISPDIQQKILNTFNGRSAKEE